MGFSLRGRRIAIGVADSPFRDSLRRALEREGATVSTQPSATRQLAAVSPPEPQACIVDVDLPDLGPRELTEAIRKDHPTMPIILVSAHLFPIEIASLKDFPTLPLPFRRGQLLELLERLLRGQAA